MYLSFFLFLVLNIRDQRGYQEASSGAQEGELACAGPTFYELDQSGQGQGRGKRVDQVSKHVDGVTVDYR